VLTLLICIWSFTALLYLIEKVWAKLLKENEMHTEEKKPFVFAGVCASCMCAYDEDGLRVSTLSDAQYSVLTSGTGKVKKRGMCRTCLVVQQRAIEIRERRAGARISRLIDEGGHDAY